MNHQEWLQERRGGIGGSDVASILGISPYKTALDVYNEKISEEFVEQQETPAMKFGKILEPVIRDMYSSETGEELVEHDQIIKKDFMIASLDGMTKSGKILEIKTSRLDKGWGEEGTDQVPIYYTTQCQHYMMVTGAKSTDVAVLIGGSDFRIYNIPANQILQDLIFKREQEFWQLVQSKTPPEAQNLNDLSALYSVANPYSIEATPEIRDKIGLLSHLNKESKELEARIDELKFDVKTFMKDSECVSMNGSPLVTYKNVKGRAATKWEQIVKTLEAKYGQEVSQLIQSNTSFIPGYRRFLIK